MDDIPEIFPVGAAALKDYAYLSAKEISNPGIEFPERLRLGIQYRKQLVAVILEKRRAVVGGLDRVLSPADPVCGIIYPDLGNLSAPVVDYRDAQILHSVGSKDPTPVAVSLLLIVFGRVDTNRVPRQDGKVLCRGEVCARKQHTLFDGAFLGNVVAADDTALRIADEVDDLELLRSIRKTGLYLGKAVGDVVALVVDSVVDVLDGTDSVGFETATAKAYDIDSRVADRLTSTQRIRGDVFVDLASAADHRVFADAGELVYHGTSAEDGPIVYVCLAGDSYVAYEDAMVTDRTVVGYVDIGHNEDVVSDAGHALSAGLGSTVDGSAFADVDAVSDFDVSNLTVELEVLRDGSHNGTRENGTVLTHLYVREDGGVGVYLATVADLDIVVDEGVRTDLDIVAEFRARMDGGKGMDVVHNILLNHLCDFGVDAVAWFVGCNLSLQETAAKPEISEEIEHFVAPTLVRETKVYVV